MKNGKLSDQFLAEFIDLAAKYAEKGMDAYSLYNVTICYLFTVIIGAGFDREQAKSLITELVNDVSKRPALMESAEELQRVLLKDRSIN